MLRKAFSFQIFALAALLVTAPAMNAQFKVEQLSTDSLLTIKRPISRTQVRVNLDKSGAAIINGFGFMPGEPVDLNVSLVSRTGVLKVPLTKWTVFADQNGAINSGWFVTGPNSTYSLSAVGEKSLRASATTFAGPTVVAAASADLDQCANGKLLDPETPCINTAWQNGNLNENQAHYTEGDSVPYRMRFQDLTVGATNTVAIEFDSIDSSKHAIDYLTTYNRTETNADPCTAVLPQWPACPAGVLIDTEPIPLDSSVTAGQDGIPGNADDITQIPGVFTLFGGNITGVSAYTHTTSSSKVLTSITITFVPTITTPVLAWAGHISTRADWGIDNSAIAINGASYHMRLIELNGTGGNQDRSLQNTAVYFPASVTIVKLVNNIDLTYYSPISFEFQSSANFGTTSFFLTDNDPLQYAGGSITNSTIVHFGSVNAITVKELAPSLNRYSLSDITCTEVGGGVAPILNTTTSLAASTANIIPDEGEIITCTFTNTQLDLTAAPASLGGRVMTSAGQPIRGAMLQVTRVATGETRYTTTGSFGYYRFDDLQTGEGYVITVNARRYVFHPNTQLIELRDNVADLNFIALQR